MDDTPERLTPAERSAILVDYTIMPITGSWAASSDEWAMIRREIQGVIESAIKATLSTMNDQLKTMIKPLDQIIANQKRYIADMITEGMSQAVTIRAQADLITRQRQTIDNAESYITDQAEQINAARRKIERLEAELTAVHRILLARAAAARKEIGQ